jgi:hypothetical protein
MAELLASYSRSGERHRIELVPAGDGALVLDRPGEGAPLVVAELASGEGREQALAVLYGEGGYLERARRGEPGLGRRLEARRGGRKVARAA